MARKIFNSCLFFVLSHTSFGWRFAIARLLYRPVASPSSQQWATGARPALRRRMARGWAVGAAPTHVGRNTQHGRETRCFTPSRRNRAIPAAFTGRSHLSWQGCQPGDPWQGLTSAFFFFYFIWRLEARGLCQLETSQVCVMAAWRDCSLPSPSPFFPTFLCVLLAGGSLCFSGAASW